MAAKTTHVPALPHPAKHLIQTQLHLHGSWASVVVIVVWFAAAFLVARAAGAVASRVIRWQDRRHYRPDDTLAPGLVAHLKRRETLISLVRTGMAGVAFLIALVMSLAQFAGGLSRLSTVVGASFLVVMLGFALQRVLIDLIAGLSMFVERWYSVGDTVIIAPHELQGVVEDVSLRRTKLRAVNGEVIHVHNSQISAVRVLPQGVKRLAVELFVYEKLEGIALVEALSAIVPVSPTHFITHPVVEEAEELTDDLYRLRVMCAVAPGREWLVEGFFLDMLKEKAEESLIVHGPVVFAVDERATRSFERATAQSRKALRRRPVPDQVKAALDSTSGTDDADGWPTQQTR